MRPTRTCAPNQSDARFCADHVRCWANGPAGVGHALIYRDIRAAAVLPTGYAPSGKLLDTLRGKTAPVLWRRIACATIMPACLIGREQVNYTVDAGTHRGSRLHAAYAAGEGICLPHLIAVLERAGTEEGACHRRPPGGTLPPCSASWTSLSASATTASATNQWAKKSVWLRAMNAVGGAGWGLTAPRAEAHNPLDAKLVGCDADLDLVIGAPAAQVYRA